MLDYSGFKDEVFYNMISISIDRKSKQQIGQGK